MNIQLVNKENYNILVDWWKGHAWTPIPYDMLPKVGFIVNDSVAGFLYATDSSMCVIEWIVSDPKSDKNLRKESIKILLDHLCNEAKKLGFICCFTYTKNKGLIQKLQENNFIKTDEDMIHFIRSL